MITETDFITTIGKDIWKLVDEYHPIKLYFGFDSEGKCAIKYMGFFSISKKIKSSELIDIKHYKISNGQKCLVVSLADKSFINKFCIFVNDIIEYTSHLGKNSKKGYETICNVYFAWQKMFKAQRGIMGEEKIKGLIGELLFLKQEMIPQLGVSSALGAWSGPDSTKKDFSVASTWYEVKTIDFGKPTVSISSIEQLQSPHIGTLVIYQVEKMSPEFQGVSLNTLVNEIVDLITILTDKDVFFDKLQEVGYSFTTQYDNYVYEVKLQRKYEVRAGFPILDRKKIPKPIVKATYEINVSELTDYMI